MGLTTDIETKIAGGAKVRIRGRLTVTEGRFEGIGISEFDEQPFVLVQREGADRLSAYRFDEVVRIEQLSAAVIPASADRVESTD